MENNMKKIKRTKHRDAIIKILKESSIPLSAEEMYTRFLDQNIPINLSTIYRSLKILAEHSIILRINLEGDNRTLYEYNRQVHSHYLMCSDCKKLISVPHCPVHKYEEMLEKETGFVIAGHRLEVYGICPDCQVVS